MRKHSPKKHTEHFYRLFDFVLEYININIMVDAPEQHNTIPRPICTRTYNRRSRKSMEIRSSTLMAMPLPQLITYTILSILSASHGTGLCWVHKEQTEYLHGSV